MSQSEVPISIIQSISSSLDRQQEHKKVEKTLVPDESLSTRKALVEALKIGQVPGSAYVEWCDEKGPLRVNVIDFLMMETVDAVDPSSGQSVRVQAKQIPDMAWRVLY